MFAEILLVHGYEIEIVYNHNEHNVCETKYNYVKWIAVHDSFGLLFLTAFFKCESGNCWMFFEIYVIRKIMKVFIINRYQ